MLPRSRSLLLTTLLAASLPLSAHADTLGVFVGGALWTQEPSGQFADSDLGSNCTLTCIDMQSDLGLEEEDSEMYWVALEHPIPILPNIRLEKTDLQGSGVNTLSRDIAFDGEVFTANTTITSDFDLSHTDYVLYYELLDNWFSLDLGINVKQFDGGVSIDSTGQSASETLDEPIPLLYVAGKIEVPATGLWFGVQGSGASTGDSEVTDYRLQVGYTFGFGLGIEVAKRTFTVDIDPADADVYGDMEFDGTYASITFHF